MPPDPCFATLQTVTILLSPLTKKFLAMPLFATKYTLAKYQQGNGVIQYIHSHSDDVQTGMLGKLKVHYNNKNYSLRLQILHSIEYRRLKHTLEKQPFFVYHYVQPYIHSPHSVFLPQGIKRLVYAMHILLCEVIINQLCHQKSPSE